MEDVRTHPRREVSPLGGVVELAPSRSRVAPKPRCRFSLLLLLCLRLPIDRVSRTEGKCAQRGSACFATIQSNIASGGFVGSEWRRYDRGYHDESADSLVGQRANRRSPMARTWPSARRQDCGVVCAARWIGDSIGPL